jgi:hypothetical protein
MTKTINKFKLKKFRVYNTNDLSQKNDQKSTSICVCFFNLFAENMENILMLSLNG